MLDKLLLSLVWTVHQVNDFSYFCALDSIIHVLLFLLAFPFVNDYNSENEFEGLQYDRSFFSGDTFTDGSVRYTMTSMNVPEPVMSLAVTPTSKDSGGQVTFWPSCLTLLFALEIVCILSLPFFVLFSFQKL